MWKQDVIHNTGSTEFIALLSEDDQATVTGNTVKVQSVIFEICERTDRQTNRQTDTLLDANQICCTSNNYSNRPNGITYA